MSNATRRFQFGRASMVSNGPKIIYGVDGKPLISAEGKPMVGGLAEQNDTESVRDEDQSIIGPIAALDIDVDEVGDRIDLLQQRGDLWLFVWKLKLDYLLYMFAEH